MVAELGMGGYFSNPEEDPTMIIRYAYRNGIRFFDTSPAYGESEKWFGEALKGAPRHKYRLSTKVKYQKEAVKVLDEFERSLERLNTDYLDLYLGHDFINSMEEWKESQDCLYQMRDLKRQGKVRAIGVSGHSQQAAIQAINSDFIDYIMIPHSIKFPFFENVIAFAKRKRVKVITMKNFGSGILLGGTKRTNEYKEEIPLKDIIGYCAYYPGVDLIIPAFRSKTQFTETQMAYEASEPILENRYEELNNSIEKYLGTNFCTFCNLCRPCEVHGWKMSQPGILKSMIYDKSFGENMKGTYEKYPLKADSCGDCPSLCSIKCPYGIDIKQSLESADRYFMGEASNGK